MRRIEDQLLGTLAVREGLCTPAQIDECLRLQAGNREAAPLGELLLLKGYLRAPQLQELLGRQHKMRMRCPSCGLAFTVLTLSDGKSARCLQCKGPLRESGAEGPPRPEPEFSTPRRPLGSAAIRSKVDQVCIVCDHPFEDVPDASGRVRCPECQSTFAFRNHS